MSVIYGVPAGMSGAGTPRELAMVASYTSTATFTASAGGKHRFHLIGKGGDGGTGGNGDYSSSGSTTWAAVGDTPSTSCIWLLARQ